MDTLTSYYVVQLNTRTNERLGISLDVSNSIHAVEENRARRFDTLEEAQTVVNSMTDVLKVTKNDDVVYKVVKETRNYFEEGVADESATV
ncbi:hypothetical protein BUZ56_07375 [Staphylococcus hyicus]|uniref:hypothetical protein n=1 Tax=Staphylococcus hyicus TaxID=1284 RepID=UPI000D1F95DF|nr:hypothetical protein [Staphylococcus hyicus]NJH82551.1 hypothetical protein [Staphylococcus hyicus]PTJ72021.1 hypothetical protein BUZ58_05660 [Staphylococcus hyicus]PTJ88156.1 hypothetical protein BUZ56_07375 [Staphylococcus hyicus]